MDITVDPKSNAQMITLKRAFRLMKESAPTAKAANEIRHGVVAL